jgi:hypothetical protein
MKMKMKRGPATSLPVQRPAKREGNGERERTEWGEKGTTLGSLAFSIISDGRHGRGLGFF